MAKLASAYLLMCLLMTIQTDSWKIIPSDSPQCLSIFRSTLRSAQLNYHRKVNFSTFEPHYARQRNEVCSGFTLHVDREDSMQQMAAQSIYPELNFLLRGKSLYCGTYLKIILIKKKPNTTSSRKTLYFYCTSKLLNMRVHLKKIDAVQLVWSWQRRNSPKLSLTFFLSIPTGDFHVCNSELQGSYCARDNSCVDKRLRCDGPGQWDCTDGSDEKGCFYSPIRALSFDANRLKDSKIFDWLTSWPSILIGSVLFVFTLTLIKICLIDPYPYNVKANILQRTWYKVGGIYSAHRINRNIRRKAKHFQEQQQTLDREDAATAHDEVLDLDEDHEDFLCEPYDIGNHSEEDEHDSVKEHPEDDHKDLRKGFDDYDVDENDADIELEQQQMLLQKREDALYNDDCRATPEMIKLDDSPVRMRSKNHKKNSSKSKIWSSRVHSQSYDDLDPNKAVTSQAHHHHHYPPKPDVAILAPYIQPPPPSYQHLQEDQTVNECPTQSLPQKEHIRQQQKRLHHPVHHPEHVRRFLQQHPHQHLPGYSLINRQMTKTTMMKVTPDKAATPPVLQPSANNYFHVLPAHSLSQSFSNSLANSLAQSIGSSIAPPEATMPLPMTLPYDNTANHNLHSNYEQRQQRHFRQTDVPTETWDVGVANSIPNSASSSFRRRYKSPPKMRSYQELVEPHLPQRSAGSVKLLHNPEGIPVSLSSSGLRKVFNRAAAPDDATNNIVQVDYTASLRNRQNNPQSNSKETQHDMII